MSNRARLEIDLKVLFVPFPPELEPAWRAGLLLLLDILKGEICDAASGESFPIFIEQTIEQVC